jgi:hypothetical protein
MENTKKKITNMETFLFAIALCCVTLGIGYQNVVLVGIAGLTSFFGFGSMFKRSKK